MLRIFHASACRYATHMHLSKKSMSFIQASLCLNEIQTMPYLSWTNLLIEDIITLSPTFIYFFIIETTKTVTPSITGS